MGDLYLVSSVFDLLNRFHVRQDFDHPLRVLLVAECLFMRVQYVGQNFMTGLMETELVSVNFTNVDKTKCARKGGIFLCL